VVTHRAAIAIAQQPASCCYPSGALKIELLCDKRSGKAIQTSHNNAELGRFLLLSAGWVTGVTGVTGDRAAVRAGSRLSFAFVGARDDSDMSAFRYC
jgi:hypothetical protein